MSLRRRDAFAIALLTLLPLAAHAPALREGRLLGPGDGAALHYPLKVLAWEAYRRGELPSWNPTIFMGTPLLAAYRPGVLYPPVVAASLLPSFAAFQGLVIASLAAAAVVTFLYVRRLGGETVGAYAAGLFFSLGPYLVGHLGDTPTVLAAPLLPLLLLAAESFMGRGTAGRAAALAASLALLLLAGSPEAARAGGALLAGRLVIGRLLAGPATPSTAACALAVLAGLLLAAPQLVPTLAAAPEAGRSVTGLAAAGEPPLPGVTGLVLRYVSHTPAPSLALAALPLALTRTPVRVLGFALALCLGLQWGRGPLAAPGALALVFDLALSVLAGLSLSAQWASRRETEGRRLRAYFLFACLASAAALSVSAAALGPLEEGLSGAVGVFALALILYFSMADSPDLAKAGVFLLPLTVSFLLQPHARGVWDGAPVRRELERGTATREAIDRAMGAWRGERILTLVREWPAGEELDLAYANLGGLDGRRSASGYDPMVPLRSRAALGGMGPAGALPGGFFRSDPDRLALFGIRWVQVPASALRGEADRFGLGEPLDVTVEAGRPRLFPVDLAAATEVRIASSLSAAEEVAQGEVIAVVHVLLATGREIPVAVRAGLETAEWAWDRADLRARVGHHRAPVLESWPAPGGDFEGHRYLGVLGLQGRFYVDGVRIERKPGPGFWTLSRLALVDSAGGISAVSLPSAYVSDTLRFREAAVGPRVRLFEVRATGGRARVVERLKTVADDAALVQALAAPASAGVDVQREALALARDVERAGMPSEGRASRAEVVRAAGGALELRAAGPGILVAAEGWDPGWSARVDGVPTTVVRVNHVQMAVPLAEGTHRVVLRYRPRGFPAGLAGAGAGAVILLVWALGGAGPLADRQRSARVDPPRDSVLRSLFRRSVG